MNDISLAEREDMTATILPPVAALRPQIVPLASSSCAQVWGALAIAQGQFEPPKRTKEATVEGISKSGNKYSYRYKYAPLDELERCIRKPLAENGLFRQQYLVSRGEQWFIRTIVGHSSGEWIASDYPVIADIRDSQKFASGVTYARRYGLSLALGLCPEDDDDAQIAESGEPARAAPPRRQRAAPISQPARSDPPHDPETGELLAPHEIAFDGDLVKWGSDLKAAVKAASTSADIDGWERKNAAMIERCKTEAPRFYTKNIEHLFSGARAKLGPEEPELVGAEEAGEVLRP